MQAFLFRRGLPFGALLCLIAATGCSGGKVHLPWQKTAQVEPSNAQIPPGGPVPPYSQARTTPPSTEPMVGQHVSRNLMQHPDAGKPLVDDPNVQIPKLPVLQRVQFGPLQ